MFKYLLSALILVSLNSEASVIWQLEDGGEFYNEQYNVHAMEIEKQTLVIRLAEGPMYIVPQYVAANAGLSLKDLFDLIKEYNTSGKDLIVKGSRGIGADVRVRSLDRLIIQFKPSHKN